MTDASQSSKTTKSKISSVDEYGFERGNSFNYEAYEEFISDYLVVLARRARKWSGLLGNREAVGKSKILKRYIRKGIPLKHRGKIWMTASGADTKLRAHPAYYDKLLKKERNKELVDVIKVDLPRTFPDNIHFKGIDSPKIASLHNVLVAFGIHNPDIGYCQGLNYIAGLMLLVVGSEEKAFWLMAVLIEDILPGYHTRDMVGVLTDIESLGLLLKEKKPLIWEHLRYNKVDLSLVTTKWFICLFVEVLPVETVLRIWDCVFYEGDKILMRVALSLILMNEQALFMSHDFSALIECFKKMPSDVRILQCHTFIQSIFKLTGPLPRSHIVQVRKKAKEIVLKQQQEFEDKKSAKSKSSPFTTSPIKETKGKKSKLTTSPSKKQDSSSATSKIDDNIASKSTSSKPTQASSVSQTAPPLASKAGISSSSSKTQDSTQKTEVSKSVATSKSEVTSKISISGSSSKVSEVQVSSKSSPLKSTVASSTTTSLPSKIEAVKAQSISISVTSSDNKTPKAQIFSKTAVISTSNVTVGSSESKSIVTASKPSVTTLPPKTAVTTPKPTQTTEGLASKSSKTTTETATSKVSAAFSSLSKTTVVSSTKTTMATSSSKTVAQTDAKKSKGRKA